MKATHLVELYSLFTRLRTVEEVELFFQDMMTQHERETLAERWQIIKRLHAGMPQRKVKEELGISIERVTRGSKTLKSSQGGFGLFL